MKKLILIISGLGIVLLNSCMVSQSLSETIDIQNERKTHKHRPKIKYVDFKPEYKKAYLTDTSLIIYSSNGGYINKPDRQVVYNIKLDELNDTTLKKRSMIKHKGAYILKSYCQIIHKPDTVIKPEYSKEEKHIYQKFEELKSNSRNKTLFINETNRYLVVADSLNKIYYNSHFRHYSGKRIRKMSYNDYSYQPGFIINSYKLGEKTDTLFTKLDSIPVLQQVLPEHFTYFYYYYAQYSTIYSDEKNSKNKLLHTVNYFLNQPECKNGFIAKLDEHEPYSSYWAYCRYDDTNKNIVLINKLELPMVMNPKKPYTLGYKIKDGIYNVVTWNYLNLLYAITVPIDIVTYPIQFVIVVSDPHFSLGGY